MSMLEITYLTNYCVFRLLFCDSVIMSCDSFQILWPSLRPLASTCDSLRQLATACDRIPSTPWSILTPEDLLGLPASPVHGTSNNLPIQSPLLALAMVAASVQSPHPLSSPSPDEGSFGGSFHYLDVDTNLSVDLNSIGGIPPLHPLSPTQQHQVMVTIPPGGLS